MRAIVLVVILATACGEAVDLEKESKAETVCELNSEIIVKLDECMDKYSGCRDAMELRDAAQGDEPSCPQEVKFTAVEGFTKGSLEERCLYIVDRLGLGTGRARRDAFFKCVEVYSDGQDYFSCRHEVAACEDELMKCEALNKKPESE